MQVLGGRQLCPWCASRLYSHDMKDYAVSMDALELMMTPQPQTQADAAPVSEKATGGGTPRTSTEEGTPTAAVRICTLRLVVAFNFRLLNAEAGREHCAAASQCCSLKLFATREDLSRKAAMQTPQTVSDRSSGTFDPDRFLTENDEDGFVADCAASYAASPLRLLLNKPQGAATASAAVVGTSSSDQSAAAAVVVAGPAVATDSSAQIQPHSQTSSGASASQQCPVSPITPQTERGKYLYHST